MPAGAVAQLEKAAAHSPGPNTMASLALAYAISGQKEKGLKILTQLETKAKKKALPPLNLHVGLGDKEKGLAALEKAFPERSALTTYSRMDPRFDPIRSDVCFTDIRRRIGLPQ
jgi:hypothetical protein